MIRTSEPNWLDTTKLLPVSKEIVLYVDKPLLTQRPSGTLIYLQVEPEAIIQAEDYLVKNYNLYDYILTFNDNVLKVCPNAIKYIYGTTWISSLVYSSIDTERKRFEVSTIIGNKLMAPGHHFRKAVYIAQDSLPKHVTYRFFKSVHCPLTLPPISNDFHFKDTSHEGKSEAFLDSQFHLVIENSRQVNYFTEKLCDCLLTKTIPIYYGCPNISEYFNTDGWILLESESVAELSEKLLAITPMYYSNYKGVIQQNFFTAMNHKDIHTNINKGLKKVESRMNSVDVIFYINLASREDRRIHFLEQIRALTTDMSKVVRIDAVYEPMGALGCTKSHIKALEAFIENPAWKTCIIFEDDFTFYDSSQTNNNTLLHKFFLNFTDWDMLLLASNQLIKGTPTEIPEIQKVNRSQTTSGYLTHKGVAQKILDNFKESAELLANSGSKQLHAIDIYWEKLGLIRYSFTPNMGYQYASMSDVENKYVEYGC